MNLSQICHFNSNDLLEVTGSSITLDEQTRLLDALKRVRSQLVLISSKSNISSGEGYLVWDNWEQNQSSEILTTVISSPSTELEKLTEIQLILECFRWTIFRFSGDLHFVQKSRTCTLSKREKFNLSLLFLLCQFLCCCFLHCLCFRTILFFVFLLDFSFDKNYWIERTLETKNEWRKRETISINNGAFLFLRVKFSIEFSLLCILKENKRRIIYKYS